MTVQRTDSRLCDAYLFDFVGLNCAKSRNRTSDARILEILLAGKYLILKTNELQGMSVQRNVLWRFMGVISVLLCRRQYMERCGNMVSSYSGGRAASASSTLRPLKKLLNKASRHPP